VLKKFPLTISMKFSIKEKMRSMMFNNYPSLQTSEICFNTDLMNLEAFSVEDSPKLLILFLKFEIWYDWLKLNIIF